MENPQEINKQIDIHLEQGHFDEALSEIEAGLQKARDPNSRARLFYRRYRALRGKHRDEDAKLIISDIVKTYDKAISNTQRPEEIADLKWTKGKICTELDLVETAEREIKQALSIYKNILNEQDRKKGIRACYNSLAQIRFRRSDYHQALRYLKEYEKYIDNWQTEAIHLGMRGRISMLQGKLGLAEKDFREANEIYQVNDNKENKNWLDTQFCKNWLELCYLYLLQRKLKEAEEFLNKADNIIKNTSLDNVDSVHTKSIYDEFSGFLAYSLGDFYKAHECYQEVFRLMETTIPFDDMICQTKRLLAELLVEEKRYPEALEVCDEGWKVAFEIDMKIEIGAIRRVLGQIYSAMEEKDKAKDHFEESISFLERIGANYELGLAYLESGRSDAFEYSERDTYLGKAKRIFKKMGIEFYVNLALESQRSLPERVVAPARGASKKIPPPASYNSLHGTVKDIDEHEAVAFVEFDVDGAPLEMEIELSDLEPISANYEGAQIEFVTEEKDGKAVTRFKNLERPAPKLER